MTTAEFTVTGRRWVTLNGYHGHHRAHQALMDTWKRLGVLAIRQAHCAPVTPPVEITATVHRTTKAKADAHNVTPTIKAVIDSAVTAGLIPDDHDGIVRRHHRTRGGGCCADDRRADRERGVMRRIPIDETLLISAVRYALGRRTYIDGFTYGANLAGTLFIVDPEMARSWETGVAEAAKQVRRESR